MRLKWAGEIALESTESMKLFCIFTSYDLYHVP